MKQFFLLSFIFIFAAIKFSLGQKPVSKCAIKVNPGIQKVADEIAKYNILESKYLGEDGAKSGQWEKYEQLKKKASEGDLKLLIENKNAVVRSYSFLALASRKTTDMFPILFRHLKDTTMMRSVFGCIRSGIRVNDFFVEVVTKQIEDSNQLSTEQKSIVDSILLRQSRQNLRD